MISPYHTSGFYYTPVTKGLLGSLVLSSVAFNIPLQNYRLYFFYTYSTVFEKFELWRYLLSRCTFIDPRDALCAAVLIYHFRIFERRYGSLKYANFLLGTFLISCGLELGVVYLCHRADLTLELIPAGPFGPVYAAFVPYFCDIPRVAITHFLGIPVTGKSLTYIIGLQLIGSIECNLLAVCGLLAGVLYRYNFLWSDGILRFPPFVGKAFDRTLGRVLYTAPPSTEQNTMVGATLEIQRQQRIEALEQQMAWAQLQQRPRAGGRNAFGFGLFGNRNLRNGGRPPEPVFPPPSDEQVQQLVEMGFTRDNVLNALQACNNDINSATNILLHQQTL